MIDNNGVLYIDFGETSNGCARIFLNRFFPCSQKILSDLYKKMIRLDNDHYYDILEGLISYFTDMMKRCVEKEERKKYERDLKYIAGILSKDTYYQNVIKR